MSEEKNKTIVGEVGSVTITEPVKSVGVLTLELNEIKTDISAETDKMLSKETSGSNLLLIFNDLFGTQEKIDSLKVKVNLQAKDIEFIKKIMTLCPELFKNIDTGLKGILADNVIDSKDIPQIIKMVKDAYKNIIGTNKNIKNITLEDSIIFIKNLILILIEYDHIKVKSKEEITLIIDLCIDLLQTNLNLNVPFMGKICDCISSFFKKK